MQLKVGKTVHVMNATVMTVNYDDFWGKGPRRTQVFLYSVSAPKCNVLNLKPVWVKNCITSHGNNETSCYRQIMDEFEVLSLDRVIQAGVEKDFGEVGSAFLKCKGRPSRSFQYQTDLMVHQSYWAGGPFHVEIQTSDCRAVPLLRNSDWQWGLFKVEAVDQEADVKIALPPRGWFGYLVTLAYGIISMGMIAYGILAVFTRVSTVGYTPQSQRFTKTNAHWMVYLAPLMPIASFFSENENASITFKGSLFMGSDIWMNHWMFIWISVLDAIVNLRMSYLTLGVGTWMLNLKHNTENFLFLCSGLTKLTWLMCLVHTAFRLLVKFVVRSLRNMNFIKSSTRDKLEWYVDATSLFLSYKVYNLLMCLIVYLLLSVKGTTTMMKKAVPAKVGVFGGRPRITNFWGNEIICDLVVLFSLL